MRLVRALATRPIIPGAGGVILKQVPAVDTRRQQCIPL